MSTETVETTFTPMGPAWGMRFRHHARGYALEQASKHNGDTPWIELCLLDNGEIAEVIGPAQSAESAVQLAEEWLKTDRSLMARMAPDGLRPGRVVRQPRG